MKAWAALDNFDATVSIRLYRHKGYPDDVPTPSGGWPGLWSHDEEPVRAFRQLQQSHPRKAMATLLASLECAEQPNGSQTQPAGGPAIKAVPVVLAVGRGDYVFVLSQAGPLSPWMVPYVYENRNGLDPALFADSPADEDEQRQYSVEVDDGVYVYSLHAKPEAETLNATRRQQRRVRVVGWTLVLVGVGSFVALVCVSWKGALASLAALFVAALTSPLLEPSCYAMAMSPLFDRRDPEIMAQRRELLDKYHSRGVIGDAAYAKSLAALEPRPTTQPTTTQEADDEDASK